MPVRFGSGTPNQSVKSAEKGGSRTRMVSTPAAVDNRGCRAGFSIRQLTALHVECVMDPVQRPVVVPTAELGVDRAAGRKVLRQRPPLASCAQNEHQAIDDLALIHSPLIAATHDRERDRYGCPAGKRLIHGGFDPRTGARVCIAGETDCRACPLRQQCTSGRLRWATRMADEDARDMARAEKQTGLYKRSMRLRRGVERLFADVKAKRGLTRLHLRGIRGAEEKFQLTAAVSNLFLLARPAERVRRPNQARAAQRRISDMERVSRRGIEFAIQGECR